MRCHHLNVDPIEVTLFEKVDQEQQRQLRRVRSQREHALTGKTPTRIDSIDSADELSAFPNFYAVCVALPVKLAIGADHLRRDPGAGFMLSFDCRAVSDYLSERMINCEVKCRFLSGPGEPSGDVHVVELEDAPFLGATPRQDVLIDRPWKNPAAVRAQKVCGRERST